MRIKSILEIMFFVLIATCVLTSCGGDDKDNEQLITPPTPTKELTFTLKVDNIKVNGADLTVIPSDKDKKYIADVIPMSLFDNKSDKEIINMIISSVNSDLLQTGDILFKADAMNLLPNTEYVFFALGVENGKANSKLARTTFKTLEETIPFPKLDIEGTVGGINGTEKYSKLMFNLKSDIANTLLYLIIDNEKYASNLENETFVEKLLNEQSVTASEEDIKLLNSDEGFFVIFDNLVPNKAYTFIARVSNKSGAVTKSVTLKTEEKPLPPKAPEIKLTAKLGDNNGNHKDSYITFGLTSQTKDVYYAELIVAAKTEVENVLKDGMTLEELATANKGNGVVLSDEDINVVNNDIYLLTLNNTDGVMPNTEYTCIALVENFMGLMTVARQDVKTDPVQEDNTPPSVDIEGKAGDVDGKNQNSIITFSVSCTSHNASYVEAFVSDTSFINEILQGTTLEDLMKFNAGIGRILEQKDLETLNRSKLLLSWNNLLGNTEYTLLLCVKTKGGGMVVKRCDVKTAPDPVGAVYSKKNIKCSIIHGEMNYSLSSKIIEHLTQPTKSLKQHFVRYEIKSDNNKLKIAVLPNLFVE